MTAAARPEPRPDPRPGWGVAAARAALARGETTATAQVEGALAAIRELEPELSAFVSVGGDEALAAAAAADERIRSLGPAAWEGRPLLGVTVAVKDLVSTADLPTTRGSLLPRRGPRADAPAVARLRAAGAVVVGKTTTSEHGWSASTVGRVAAATRNPWDTRLSAGGSSGGSAAAVAAGLCAAALGTDGAGSVRIPASFCGIVGFKPSFARVPYVPPCADRLSHLGPMTASVDDAAELAAVLFGPHRGDPDSRAGGLGPLRPPGPLRVGWLEFPGTDPRVRAATERVLPVLAGLGHRVTRTEVPFTDPYPALVAVLAASEAASIAPEDEPWCDPGRVAVARYGRTVSGAAVVRAEEARLALRTTMRMVMERFDLLVMATVPVVPYPAGAIGPDWAAEPADLRWLEWTPATYPFNLTGQPALSLPVGLADGRLPVGLQLVGPVGADELVLAAAREVEARLEPLPAPPTCAPTPR